MSNLSDIGFPVENEDAYIALLERIQPHATEVKAQGGSYFLFNDPSGAQLWLQVNARRELIGLNPHFGGQTRRIVRLKKLIERDTSPLDGSFYAWAGPHEEGSPETPTDEAEGDYPFVFDVPDARTLGHIALPHTLEIQLAAFASDDLELFDDEDAYHASQEGEVKFASRSFIPTGLFTTNESGDVDTSLPPQPYGLFAGTITACQQLHNETMDASFWWMAVETLGGAVDVVAAPDYVATPLRVGGVVSGSFYLSGRVLNAPTPDAKPRFSWAWRRGN